MTIGLIVAIPDEIDELLKSIGTPLEKDEFTGYEVMHYRFGANDVYVTDSGAGEISAASTTQLLITKYHAEMIMNFGVVGGLTDEMKVCNTVVVESVVHYDFDCSEFLKEVQPAQYAQYETVYIPTTPAYVKLALSAEPNLKSVICASGDKFIADPEKKRDLNTKYKAQICEMESAGIVLTCHRNNVPMLLIKAVSDSVSGGGDEFAAMVSRAAATAVKVLLKVFEQV